MCNFFSLAHLHPANTGVGWDGGWGGGGLLYSLFKHCHWLCDYPVPGFLTQTQSGQVRITVGS